MFIQDQYANNHFQNLFIFFLFLKNKESKKSGYTHTHTHTAQPAHLLKRIAWILCPFSFFIQITSFSLSFGGSFEPTILKKAQKRLWHICLH